MSVIDTSRSKPTFASATSSSAVTASDATVVNFKALYVGTGGNVVIKHLDTDSAVTYTNVLSGTILPVAGCRVMAATTASNIVAMNW